MNKIFIVILIIFLVSCSDYDKSTNNLKNNKIINNNINENKNNKNLINKTKQITIINQNNKKININTEIADTPEKLTKGLMFRTNLEKNSGMFFIFPKEQILSFWMKNTLIPLDMIFINKNKTIINIKENTQPCKQDPCPSYGSTQPAIYVLEVNAGFAKENNIKTKDIIII